MSENLTIQEAADAKGMSYAGIHYHAQRRPELFGGERWGRTITKENLEILFAPKPPKPKPHPKLKPVKAPAPPPELKRAKPLPTAVPAVAPARIPNTRIQKVGWWCKRCGDVVPEINRLCHCLNGFESIPAIERFKVEKWLPAYVDIYITPTGIPK